MVGTDEQNWLAGVGVGRCLWHRKRNVLLMSICYLVAWTLVGTRIFIFVTEVKLWLHLLYCLSHKTRTRVYADLKLTRLSEHQRLALQPSYHIYGTYISGVMLSASSVFPLHHLP